MKQTALIKGFVAVVGSLVLTCGLMAKESKTTLLVHHFLSSKSPNHTKMLTPWAEKVMKDSNGKIDVEIFPSMTMGGKPNELYKQVRDGTADIIWVVAGYTPGVFPRTEVFELPTVHQGSAYATTMAIKENYDLIKEDFKDVVPLVIHVNGGNAFHTVSKKITQPSDVKGLKLRTPSRTGGWYLTELGAEPVGMPLPAAPQALSKKAIDGLFTAFDVFPPYKLQQLTQYSTEDRFGASVMLMLMNKDKYNSLSKELKKVIDDNSGWEFAKTVGTLFDAIEKPGMKLQRESKDGEVVKIDQKAKESFDAIGQKVVDKWIAESKEKGIDGAKLVEAARTSIEKYSK